MRRDTLFETVRALFTTLRQFKPDDSDSKTKPPNALITLGGKTHINGTNHMISSQCNSDGTQKTCTCGWSIMCKREDNWGDIRRANTIASRHLFEHSKRGDKRT